MKSAALLLVTMLWPGCVLTADTNPATVEGVLGAARMPDGVVFEIMAWEDRSWDWAAPMLRDNINQLRRRYPGLEIALISHGHELFDLALDNRNQHQGVLELLAGLHEQGVDIHIDGEYARWKRLAQQDFPAFVNVSESGSAQLEDYLKLGFVLIRLEAPDATD